MYESPEPCPKKFFQQPSSMGGDVIIGTHDVVVRLCISGFLGIGAGGPVVKEMMLFVCILAIKCSVLRVDLLILSRRNAF